MEQIETAAGEGRYEVHIISLLTGGSGICVFMTGGDRPHNGGTVVACPRLKSNAKNSSDLTADIWVSGVPGHKDTEIGIPVAKFLAVHLNQAVSLTVGIHIDHADGKEIQILCDNCMKAAGKLAEEVLK